MHIPNPDVYDSQTCIGSTFACSTDVPTRQEAPFLMIHHFLVHIFPDDGDEAQLKDTKTPSYMLLLYSPALMPDIEERMLGIGQSFSS